MNKKNKKVNEKREINEKKERYSHYPRYLYLFPHISQLSLLFLSSLIFTLLFIGDINATTQSQQPLSLTTPWIMWGYVLVLIVLSLLGIGYMIAKVFGIPAWEAWIKEEWGDILFSIFLIVVFSAFAGSIETVSSSLAKDILQSRTVEGTILYWQESGNGRWSKITTSSPVCDYPCHFYIARGFLGSSYELYGEVVKNVTKVFSTSKFLETIGLTTNFILSPDILKWELSFSLGLQAGRSIFNNSLETILDQLLKVLAVIKAQEYSLLYLQNIVWISFSVGILLRIPWFTRKLGGLLVALAIGIYTILPLTYVLAWYTADRSTVTLSLTMPDLSKAVQTDITTLLSTASPPDADLLFPLLEIVGKSYIIAFLVPTIAIFTFIGFVRHFSPMIGGDAEIAGLTRLI